MKIMLVLAEKSKNLSANKIPTIAFLGDSVTQGCFELYMKDATHMETYFDKNSACCSYVAKILSVLFPNVPVNIINAGISGDSAVKGAKRLDRDVLSMKPDLTVVSFGLNDCKGGEEKLQEYTDALKDIFVRLKTAGSEVIFMTENMMNTELSCHIKEEIVRETAQVTMEKQNGGILEMYFEAAKKAASECGAVVCDVYSKWKLLAKNGVNTTELLANKINHPTREMNWLFAFSLIETMMM